jgi:photosystem II stability/assembly factor-like uncharacterized protein
MRYVLLLALIGLLTVAIVKISRSNFDFAGSPPLAEVKDRGNLLPMSERYGLEIQPVPLDREGAIIAFGLGGYRAILDSGSILISRDNGEKWESVERGFGQLLATTDGGESYHVVSSVRRDGGFDVRDLCGIQDAVITPAHRLYVQMNCEHVTQIWSVPLDRPNDQWNGVVFTYDSLDKGVLSPGGSFVVAGNRVLIVGVQGRGSVLLTTEDEGRTWTPFWNNSIFGPGIIGFSFPNKDLGWLLLSDGNLLRTADGGKRWNAVSTIDEPGLAGWASMSFSNERSGVIVGEHGLLLKTDDGGLSWTRARILTDSSLYCVKNGASGQIWIAGSSGLVLQSHDGGLTWNKTTLQVKRDIYFTMTVYDGGSWIVSGKNVFRLS